MSNVDPQADVKAILAQAQNIAKAFGRDDDLGDRIRQVSQQINNPELQVVIIGEFKQGKSSLINTMLDIDSCSVDDDIATAVQTVIRYGAQPKAALVIEDKNSDDPKLDRIPIEFNSAASYANDSRQPPDGTEIVAVEVEVPRRLLEQGVNLIDTPGTGGLASAHSARAMKAVSVADATLFVSDASQEYTKTELEFLAHAVKMTPIVVGIMTKIDLYPDWRKVHELNQGHLRRAGINIDVHPVSAFLAKAARKHRDNQLSTESGVQNVANVIKNVFLTRKLAEHRELARRSVATVCDRLAEELEAERSILDDPAQKAELMENLEAVEAKAEKLNSALARWHHALADGRQDISNKSFFDLQERLDAVQNEAEGAIESFDPLLAWDEFLPWLESSVSSAVIKNYQFLTERASALASEVAEYFDADSSELVAEMRFGDAGQVFARVSSDRSLRMTEADRADRGLSVVRGSYSGFLMASMLAPALPLIGLAGVATGFIGLPIALVIGWKTAQKEKERLLKQNRVVAIRDVQKYIRDVKFQVKHDSDNTVTSVYRRIRGHYMTLSDEMKKSSVDSRKKANEAVRMNAKERQARLPKVLARLKAIDELRAQGQALVPAAGTGQ